MSTVKYQKHSPNSYGFKFNSIHEEHSKPIKTFMNSDPDIVTNQFINDVEEYAIYAYSLIQLNKTNIIMTAQQKITHKSKKSC